MQYEQKFEKMQLPLHVLEEAFTLLVKWVGVGIGQVI